MTWTTFCLELRWLFESASITFSMVQSGLLIFTLTSPSNSLSGNRSNPVLNSAGKDDKNHSWVYKMEDIISHPDVGLTRGGLILIGLLSGGDYEQGGLQGCGMQKAVALAKCGFGDTLYKAATTLPREKLPSFLDNWRHEMRHEISTNSRGVIGRKSPALAKSLTSAFPDIDILLSYVNPITSESMGKPYSPGDIRWNREPDISKLAGICEQFFEWGYKEAIIKRFRTVIWHSAVQRILRRAVLDLDQGKRPGAVTSSHQALPKTPSRSGRAKTAAEPCGTPSKMITKYFSTMSIHQRDDDDDEEEERLIVKIHSTRTHVSTDELLEYRLEIAPGQLVRLAEHGIQGTRPKPTQEWESEEEGDKDQASTNPEEHMRLWMPACMVKLVEPGLVEDFEAEVARKAAKKAGKGQGRGKKKKVVDDDDGDALVSSPKAKSSRSRPAHGKGADDDGSTSAAPAARGKTTAVTTSQSKGKSKAIAILSSDEESEVGLPSPSRLFPLPRQESRVASTTAYAEPQAMDVFSPVAAIEGMSPSPRRRVGIRDLTKKKGVTSTTTATLTSTTSALSKGKTSTSQLGVSVPAFNPGSTSTKNAVASLVNPKRPINASAAVTVAKTSTVTTTSAISKTKTKAAPFPVLAFFDDKDDDDDDEMMDYNALFTSPSRNRKPVSAAGVKSTYSGSSSSSASASSGSPLPTILPSASGSPSKVGGRCYHQRKSPGNEKILSSSSDSDSLVRHRKSPRKSSSHSSPATNSLRCGSPTPHFGSPCSQSDEVEVLGVGVPAKVKAKALNVGGRSVSGSSRAGGSRATTAVKPPSSGPKSTAFPQVVKKPMDLTNLPVYEISSDSDEDDDDELPPRIFSGPGGKGSNKTSAFTTTMTKTRTTTTNSRKVGTANSSSNSVSIKQTVQIDFIDLT